MSGSARPPETSFTATAPASSARAATSARIVSMESTAPRAGQRLDHRDHPAQFLGRFGTSRAGTGGLTADVEQVGAFGQQLVAVLDRGGRLEPLATVGEGVRGHVDDAHHQTSGGRRKTPDGSRDDSWWGSSHATTVVAGVDLPHLGA